MGQLHHIFIHSEMMGFFHKVILMWESILCYLLQLSLMIQLTLLKIRRTLEFQEQHFQWDKHQPQLHSRFSFQIEDIRPPSRVKISSPTSTRNVFFQLKTWPGICAAKQWILSVNYMSAKGVLNARITQHTYFLLEKSAHIADILVKGLHLLSFIF